MNHPTVSLCADSETLETASASIQRSPYNTSGWVAAVSVGDISIQNFGDATPDDLAATLDYLAGQVWQLAANAQNRGSAA